jgi:hypothetical protein
VFRFLPPHLIVLVALLVFLIWMMLVHQIRKSATVQRFLAEAFGDDTPESALRTFESAKRRLSKHLNNDNLNDETRHRIELAIGKSGDGEFVEVFERPLTPALSPQGRGEGVTAFADDRSV